VEFGLTRFKEFLLGINMKTQLFSYFLLITSFFIISPLVAKEEAVAGTSADIAYAQKLWNEMSDERLVGRNPKLLEPFFGGAKPHGMILEIAYQNIEVDGHEGFVVVKKNYNGEGVSVEAVKQQRDKFLSSLTIMYQRENGYDEDNQNWFWVKYKPDGSLFSKQVDGQPLSLAGRLIKGATREENRGCIYCHASAGGGDYIFYPNIKKP
jgi:hypothetical protein